jgi:Spy/CpxP family protein refolding chaperone
MKSLWKYVLLSFAIGFFVGASIGVGACRFGGPRWMRPHPEAMMRRFAGELQLSPEQRTQIGTIFQANREKMRASRQAIRAATREDIRRLLTPEQQAKFDAMEAKRDARSRKWEDRSR